MNESLLTLFFTSDTGINSWSQVGNLNREVAIYKYLYGLNIQSQFITYDSSVPFYIRNKLKPIRIMPTPWYSSHKKTSYRALIRYFPTLMKSDLLKTNQIPGSEIALWIQKILKKPLIVRCGYLHSLFTQENTRNFNKIQSAQQLERMAFNRAHKCVVTTRSQQDYIITKYSLQPDKVSVIPNYVQTDIFSPDKTLEKKWDLLYIGRSSPQKNLFSLLKALKELKRYGNEVSLLLLGGSGQDNDLTSYIRSEDLMVAQMPNVPNEMLPKYINSAKAFILPSFYEGHPKVLLEAMSCGVPCIGTPVPGIQEEIHHEHTGYLTKDTTSSSLAEMICYALEDEKKSYTIGKKARNYISSHYSLEVVGKHEYNLIQDVMNTW